MNVLDTSRTNDPLDAIRADLRRGSKPPWQCDVDLSQICDGVRAVSIFPGDYKRKTRAITKLKNDILDAQIELDKASNVDWLAYRRGILSAREMARQYFRRKAIDDQMLKQGGHSGYWSARLKTGSLVLRHIEMLKAREYSDCHCGGEIAGRDAGLQLLNEIFEQNLHECDAAYRARADKDARERVLRSTSIDPQP